MRYRREGNVERKRRGIEGDRGQRECIYSTPNIFCQVKRMLYNSIYIYLYMYTGAPRLGSARRECYFCMSVACCMVLRCGKFSGLYQGLRGCRKRFDGIKRLNCERGRLCLSVVICFGWISLPLECLQRDTALLDEKNEDKNVKRQSWFGLNVE